MASEFNAAFHQLQQQQGFHQHQQQQLGVPYNSGGAMSNSSSGSGGYELFSMENYYNSSGGSMNLSPNDGSAGGIQIFSSAAAQNNSTASTSSLLLDSVPGLKHDTGLAVEWSVDEQYRLEEGLAKYANEPQIMRYIKIASSLHDKTVRDVALRCKWMMRKRRKQEDQTLGKKIKDRKDKFMESPLKNNMSLNVPLYSSATNHHHQSGYMVSGVPSSPARHLLEENNQAFGQISTNLSTLKLQENIGLFCRTRNNITTILNDMRNMPGIMSQMPPLPVLLNEELATSIFPHLPQPTMFGTSSSIPLKQEPGC